jgi:hypothetical protein
MFKLIHHKIVVIFNKTWIIFKNLIPTWSSSPGILCLKQVEVVFPFKDGINGGITS